MHTEEMTRLAQCLFDALERGDVSMAKTFYAPRATLWSNVTQSDALAAEVAAFLPTLLRRVPDLRYADRRVIPFENGFIHRHRLAGTRTDGTPVAVECCVVAFVHHGLITRLEEYADSRQIDAVMLRTYAP